MGNEKLKRYHVAEDGHTVLDLERDGDPETQAICEVYEEADAILICRALNAYKPLSK